MYNMTAFLQYQSFSFLYWHFLWRFYKYGKQHVLKKMLSGYNVSIKKTIPLRSGKTTTVSQRVN